MLSVFRLKRIGWSNRFIVCSRVAIARLTSLKRVRAPWVAPSSPRFCVKRCSVPSSMPSVTAGASSFVVQFIDPRPVYLPRTLPRSHIAIVSRLPCGKPLRMLLLPFPEQPVAGYCRGPHGSVDASAGGESVKQWVEQEGEKH